ncbi:MAG: BREX-6 system adenine-specific DNA-methyltransferase PglX [Planctomycetota bacterium]|nr:BREX-6 system adenine-specific DNA-methyltransferase PglX [Planctomycetota bacterium]
MTMTSDAKRFLSTMIRGLRARLLDDLHAATEATYRLSVPAGEAELPEAATVQRRRLETWIGEQVRAQAGSEKRRTADDFRGEVEKQAAYTLLNRLVILRLMEAAGLRSPKIVTGGWESPAYKTLRELASGLIRGDETEGFAFLLQLVFEDLATDLPGLYGPAGVADLVPLPTATLRHVVESLDNPDLETCWTDDMTLGWVYQYWNDPEREALDAKLNAGGKVEPHEIASKTQMFTERYIVDWLLQNSLGPMWLAMCKKHGWTPEVEADGTLAGLEERRAEWRGKRDRGEVSLTELMPLRTDAEHRWAYYVPQPIPEDAVTHAPVSVRDLKILDPAVGSGHFLMVAFDLLVALYREESRHRASSSPRPGTLEGAAPDHSPRPGTPGRGVGGEGQDDWTDRAIVERILEHNLHGIDLDPRAVQIAAAALWLKAQQTCADARPSRFNLVASNLRLASLPDDDPALVELRREVQRETGIPPDLTDTVVHSLKGADHLGSLLKVNAAVDDAIRQHEEQLRRAGDAKQKLLFEELAPRQQELRFDRDEVRVSVLDRLEAFLAKHTGGDDLGLRLRGEQLAAGVRFVRMVREGTYDLVVGNPPYQGTSKMQDAGYVKQHYPRGKADLYAAFLERGLQLVRQGGTSGLLTMRSWMFIKQYSDLRIWLLETYDLRSLGDFDRGAFEEIPDERVAVVVSILRQARPSTAATVCLQPTPLDDRTRDNERTLRKRAAISCHIGRYRFEAQDLKPVPDWPVVYWWGKTQFDLFVKYPTLGQVSPARAAQSTSDNSRFLRFPWEVRREDSFRQNDAWKQLRWVPCINGSQGRRWIEPVSSLISWADDGLSIRVLKQSSGQGNGALASEKYFFKRGITFCHIGNTFEALAHRERGVFTNMGTSTFPTNVSMALCAMNSSIARGILQSLNPGIHFEAGDVNRLPLFTVVGSERIFSVINSAFSEHEFGRETSVEFRHPGPSPWCSAQKWAQAAVDRADGAPLPPYEPRYDAEPPTDHVSFVLGVALGRFEPNGDGILDSAKTQLSHALPAGILFLDGTLDGSNLRDSLGHPAAGPLVEAWGMYGPAIDAKSDLRDYLRTAFFENVHRKMYENRPIHLPLSSEKRTFVAWVNIHRWSESTLRVLLADHLKPTLARLEGELGDIRAARDGADKKAAREAEKRLPKAQKWRDELAEFVAAVEQCAEKGPPPVDGKCLPREADARYVPDLDDGVMINSAALWPLLTPQWKDPKKWWKELANAEGKKDYDWSHLAMRYWPTRVDAKCQQDPSLGVAHGCFWKYHPARAWAWELRLQHEIGPDFRIEEASYRDGGGHADHRVPYLRDHAEEALEAIEKEALRRRRKQKKAQAQLRILESGFWSRVPDKCWDLERRIIEKQAADFHLLAPDEPECRAAYEAAHPEQVPLRQQLLDRVTREHTLFPDDEQAVSEEETEASEEESDEGEAG